MPRIKNALLRYRIIDRALSDPYNPYPSKDKLRTLCAQELFGSDNMSYISASTLEKDMKAMKDEFDAPIRYSKSREGYYYTDPEFTLEGVPLNQEEIESIRMAVKTLEQFRNVGFFSNFGSAIDKLMAKVNAEEEFGGEQQDGLVQFEKAPSGKGTEHIPLLLRAINEKRTVQFVYAKYQSNDTEFRRINPYLLKEYRNRWYVIGHSHLKDDLRTFGLDRIDEPELLADTFRVRKFDQEEYFHHSVGITAGGTPTRIRFRTSPTLSRYLISQEIHSTQQVIKQYDDGSTEFEINVYVTPELMIILQGYGASLEVIEPQELRDTLLGNARKIQDLYD